jgi:hypothetical protein
LAIISFGVIAASLVIESDKVLILILFAQTQEAIGRIVTVWLAEFRTAQPPRGFVRSAPRFLILILPVHRIGGAASATILRPSNVNDPMRLTKWFGRGEESAPVGSRRWSKNLGTRGAAALVF